MQNSKPKHSSQDTPARSSASGATEKEDTLTTSFNSAAIVSFLKTLLILIVLAVFLRGTVVEAYRIPSGSMVPTLRDGDFILVSKLSYGLRLPFLKQTLWRYADPKRGEVVVFTRPNEEGTFEDESTINIVKRIVAIGGDRVSLRDRQLYVNGEPLREPYAQYTEPFFPEGEFPELIVPEGRVFMLGDNRDQSKDSRFWETQFLPLELVKGRALIIYWSWYDLARIGTRIR